jgi:hypothetical protein
LQRNFPKNGDGRNGLHNLVHGFARQNNEIKAAQNNNPLINENYEAKEFQQSILPSLIIFEFQANKFEDKDV